MPLCNRRTNTILVRLYKVKKHSLGSFATNELLLIINLELMKTSINLKNMRILLSMLFVFLSVNAVAQNITGTVKDNLGEPAIGASVVEKGTSNGTITDVDGKFTLKVSGKYPIEVSYIGYMTQVINLKGKTSMNIILLEDTKTLDEVVVVGYGTVKKADLSGSVVSIN